MRIVSLMLVASVSLVQAPPILAQDLPAAEVSWTEIADRVYLHEGFLCNVVAVTGPDGILLIDSGPAAEVERLRDEITKLDAGPVQFVINTHFHFDHVGGNEHLAEGGAVIIAHDDARQHMQAEQRIPDSLGIEMPIIPPYPEAALPMLTFKASTTVHLDGQPIELIKLPDGHTVADVAVLLRDANVLHTGDAFFSNSFPLFESLHGGSIDGLIAEVEVLIDRIDDGTVVVPGHGPLSNRLRLNEYRDMLKTSRDRIAALIDEGKSMEEVLAANPTQGLYRHGEPWLPPEWFVKLVYVDLARR